jgi:hypothetical protein
MTVDRRVIPPGCLSRNSANCPKIWRSEVGQFLSPLAVKPTLSGIDVGLDSIEGAAAVRARDGIAVDVVPDSSHRLLERPAASALPFFVVASEVGSEQFATGASNRCQALTKSKA